MSASEKVLETVVDIAYYAGSFDYFSGDSRRDVREIMWWAKEFETLHENTDWDRLDYMIEIESYTQNKLLRARTLI